MVADTREILQPIHPSIRDRLEPEYVRFHDTHLQNVRPDQDRTWHPDLFSVPSPLSLGSLQSEPVGSIRDRDIATYQLRAFTPESDAPPTGWPALLWFHGGGWVMGGLDSENSFLTIVCKRVRCVVVTVNYRHAPEHVFPAAIEDAKHSLNWIVGDEGRAWLDVDPSRLSIGGLSAGGCLAAIASMNTTMALRNQVLICPVIDNTATEETIWAESQHAPWLTPARMKWYRSLYFPCEWMAERGDASPCFGPVERSPRTFIAIAECDLLAPEEREFAEQLASADVKVDRKEYRGGTHSILVLAGILPSGKKLVDDVCEALIGALR